MKRQLAGILLTCLATAAFGADEETFDKYKGKLYAVYAQELKINPGYKVKSLVLEIKIATDGHVTNCRVLSSDAPNPRFSDKVCAQVREFQFPPREVATTQTKPLGFFP